MPFETSKNPKNMKSCSKFKHFHFLNMYYKTSICMNVLFGNKGNKTFIFSEIFHAISMDT